MTDWASEIATQLFDTFIVTDIIIDPIAAALRKAKADGYAEAAADAAKFIASEKFASDTADAIVRKLEHPPT